MELPTPRYLQINGDISVELVTGRIPLDPFPYLYLIMGPTGAGKSSFIEALSGESQQLSISKDQLEGYTQTVNAYHIVNIASYNCQLYLIDTPGFSDSKISEIEIMDMVSKWLKNNGADNVHKLLFLTPIAETRLPGNRRRTIKMLKQLLAPTSDVHSVTFVTTMWDMLHNEQTRKRAESNFAQLRDEVCKEFFGQNTVSITRFMNTKSSALEALDAGEPWSIDSFSNPTSSAFPNLYQDLHERIEGAIQAKQMIESELAEPEAQANADLRAILKRNHVENHETLTKFIAQLANFGTIPNGLEESRRRLQASIKAMQCTPPPPLLQHPTLPANESATVVTIATPSNQYATILQSDEDILATAPPLSEQEPLHIITTTRDDARAASETDAVPQCAHPDPTTQPSPTSIIRLNPPRMLILKGLLRRLIQAAKRRRKEWFKKTVE